MNMGRKFVCLLLEILTFNCNVHEHLAICVHCQDFVGRKGGAAGVATVGTFDRLDDLLHRSGTVGVLIDFQEGGK